jgi:hypothetical protein
MNENNWFAKSMLFVGVHWMEFVPFILTELATTCTIIAYHHLNCEFEPHNIKSLWVIMWHIFACAVPSIADTTLGISEQ